MNERPQTHADIKAQDYTRVTLLLRRLQAALHARGSKAPTYIEMEKWTGIAEGTLKDWFNNKGRPTAEFALNLMERVSEAMRHGIVDTACRTFPTLEHPRLACDKTVTSQLKTVVLQSNGLTFIQGQSDEARTFLLSAMGHSFLSLIDQPRAVCGIDIHETDWFVGVPGVNYLHNAFHPDKVREAVQQLWPSLLTGRNGLILLNGVWNASPELQQSVHKAAVRCPVIIAHSEAADPVFRQKRLTFPINLIKVSVDRNAGNPISVEVRAI